MSYPTLFAMYLPTIASVITLAAAVPYTINTPSPTTPLLNRRTPVSARTVPCSIPGQLLCRGLKEFGLCTEAHTITWQAVSDGTSCFCSSPDDCGIIAAGDSASGPTAASTSSMPTFATLSAPAPSTTTSEVSLSSPTPPNTTTSPKAPSATPGTPINGSAYTQFNGNGSPQQGWPALSDWLSFEEMFAANSPIGSTCETSFGVPNNALDDNTALHDALLAEAEAAGVPPEFAFAITLQESLGCVFVDTTYGSVRNPGLMQDHDGSSTCYGQATCSQATIQGMLKQGLSGTSSGAGIKQCHAQAPSQNPAQAWYQAARIYNSGSLGPNGSLGADSHGTSCYVSDIANRLIGWSQGLGGCTAAD